MHLYSYLLPGCQVLNNLYFFSWVLRQMLGCLFQTSAPNCLVKRADSFCETGLVISPDNFSDALIPDASSIWLFDDDETRDFSDFIRLD